MGNFFSNFFDSTQFMPHGHCYLWRPSILWLSVGSDFIIALSYFTIPMFLIYFVLKRKDAQFNWIFGMFALFIIACGVTHLMDIWTVWSPYYGWQSIAKLFTAVVSCATAVSLAPLMPRALAQPTLSDIEENKSELKRLNQQLTLANLALEERVHEKARDLNSMEKIIQYSNDAIVAENAEGEIISWNPSAERLFGFTASEAVGKSIFDLIIPSDRVAETNELIKRSRMTVTSETIETERISKDKWTIALSITYSPIKDVDGSYAGTSSISRDISFKRQTELKLLQSETRFKQVIESAPNGILMIDKFGKIVLCNKEFESLFGYDRKQMIGQTMEFLVPVRFRAAHPGHRSAFFQKPETRQMGAGRDLYGLRKDGTEFPVEIGLNPLILEEGTFVLASIVDITKRKVLEDKLRHTAEAIQQKNQEMEQFVYTVSHDLKSPLVTSSGFLGLLKEDVQAKRYDKIDDSVFRLERANSRMGQLINDLLQLSRIGRIKLDLEPLDAKAIIRNVCENLSSQIKENLAVINVAETFPPLFADKERFYQVVENLIINALKYGLTETNRTIEIGSKETDLESIFYVRDFGHGIDKEYHQKIFGLFQRLENDSRGTGVGLAIVSRAMQLHSGKTWVESSPGNGATFYFAFPKQIKLRGGIDLE